MGKKSYLAPEMMCRVKFFLEDEFGRHVPWKEEVWGNRTDSRLADKKMSLELANSDPDACRETLCNDFLDFFQNLDGGHGVVVPADRILTMHPPTDSRGKPTVKDTLVLEYKISVPEFPSSKIFNHMGDSCEDVYYTPAFKLATTKERQRELFRLLDAVLGSVAMLTCGPRAYVRSGSNKLPEPKITYGKDYDGWGYGYTLNYGYDDSDYKEDKYRFAESWFKYNGLSSLVFKHPVVFSLILGLGRFCFELYIDGKYEAIDKSLNITAVRQRLNLLKRKKSLSPQDKRWLFQRLYRLYPYFSTKKVRQNLGAYPLNTYTWSMFKKFVQEMERPQGFIQAWQSTPRDFYGASNYGFYQWCKRHAKPTKQFLKAGKDARRWSGTNGSMVYL